MLADALEHLVRGIVDNPRRRHRHLQIAASRRPAGGTGQPRGPRRVIGRSGRTARALRTVVGALADSPVRVDVVDTDRR